MSRLLVALAACLSIAAAAKPLAHVQLLQKQSPATFLASNGNGGSTYRNCEASYLDQHYRFHLFVYVDQCLYGRSDQVEPQCTDLTYFGKCLLDSFRDDFGLQGEVVFLMPAGCSCACTAHFENALTDPPTAADFDCPTCGNDNVITLAILIHLYQYGEWADYPAGGTFGHLDSFFDIYVGEAESTAHGDPHHHPNDYNSFEVGSLAELPGFNRLEVIREFTCGHTPNTVPIQHWYLDGDDSYVHTCQCECIPGYQWDSASDPPQCVAIDLPGRYCPWDSMQCYTFRLGADLGISRADETCDACIGEDDLPLPHPIDNYVQARINYYDVASTYAYETVSGVIPNPLIDGGQPYDCAPYVLVKVTSAHKDTVIFKKYFSWWYYCTSCSDIFKRIDLAQELIQSNDVEFTVYTGMYTLDVYATDYENDPVHCTTTINIVDDLQPESSKYCTTDGSGSTPPCTTFPVDATEAATCLNNNRWYIDHYYDWVSCRENDPCGYQPTDCDDYSYTQDCFGDPSATEDAPAPTAIEDYFLLKTEDENYLRDICGVDDASNAIILKGTPGTQENCVKNYDLDHTFREWVDPCLCDQSSIPSLEFPADGDSQCEDGETCNYDMTLCYPATSLFYVTKAIKTEVQQETTYLVDTLTNPEYDDATQYIHYGVHHKCAQVGGYLLGDDTHTPTDLCVIKRQMDSLFDLESFFTAAVTETGIFPCIVGSTCDADEFVKFRYCINDGPWVEFIPDGCAEETFDMDVNTVVIEAWSMCGRIDRMEYLVILHIHRPFQVCPALPKMLSQRQHYIDHDHAHAHGDDDRHYYCNVPGSPFADITFSFNPSGHFVPTELEVASLLANVDGTDSVNEAPDQLQYTFNNVRCTASFIDHQYDSNPECCTAPAEVLNIGHAECASNPNPDSPYAPFYLPISIDYAIEYPTTVTRKHHHVKWCCEFVYDAYYRHQSEGAPQQCTEDCCFEMHFHDCDQPSFDECDDCNPQGKRLFEACNGNRITWSGDRTDGACPETEVTFHDDSDDTCSQTCGSATCCDMVEGVNEGIKRCVPTEVITEPNGPYKEVVVRGDYVFAVRTNNEIVYTNDLDSGAIVWETPPVDTSTAGNFDIIDVLDVDFNVQSNGVGRLCLSAEGINANDQNRFYTLCTRQFADASPNWDTDLWHHHISDIQMEEGVFFQVASFNDGPISHGHFYKNYRAGYKTGNIEFRHDNIAWDNNVICGVTSGFSGPAGKIQCTEYDHQHPNNQETTGIINGNLNWEDLNGGGYTFIDVDLWDGVIVALTDAHLLYYTNVPNLGTSVVPYAVTWTPLLAGHQFTKISYDGAHVCGVSYNDYIVECHAVNLTLMEVLVAAVKDLSTPTTFLGVFLVSSLCVAAVVGFVRRTASPQDASGYVPLLA